MKGSFLLFLLVMTACSKTGVNSPVIEIENSAAALGLKADTTEGTRQVQTNARLTVGDTIAQKLIFDVSGNNFEFEIKYVIKEPYEYSRSWEKGNARI